MSTYVLGNIVASSWGMLGGRIPPKKPLTSLAARATALWADVQRLEGLCRELNFLKETRVANKMGVSVRREKLAKEKCEKRASDCTNTVQRLAKYSCANSAGARKVLNILLQVCQCAGLTLDYSCYDRARARIITYKRLAEFEFRIHNVIVRVGTPSASSEPRTRMCFSCKMAIVVSTSRPDCCRCIDPHYNMIYTSAQGFSCGIDIATANGTAKLEKGGNMVGQVLAAIREFGDAVVGVASQSHRFRGAAGGEYFLKTAGDLKNKVLDPFAVEISEKFAKISTAVSSCEGIPAPAVARVQTVLKDTAGRYQAAVDSITGVYWGSFPISRKLPAKPAKAFRAKPTKAVRAGWWATMNTQPQKRLERRRAFLRVKKFETHLFRAKRKLRAAKEVLRMKRSGGAGEKGGPDKDQGSLTAAMDRLAIGGGRGVGGG